MELSEFIISVKKITSIYDENIHIDVNSENIEHPKNFFLINTLKAIDIDKYIESEFSNSGLEFCFHDKNDFKFLIKNEDIDMEDPPLYYHHKPYLEHSSSFLLTELAEWYAESSPNVYSFKHEMISGKINNICDIFIQEKDYNKKLKISEKFGVFFIIEYYSNYKIVAKNEESLKSTLGELGLIKTEKDKKNVTVAYDSDIIYKGTIDNNILTGETYFVFDFVNVSVVLDKENTTSKDFDKVVKRWDKKIKKELTPDKLDEIKKEVSKEITKASYSQAEKYDNTFIDGKTKNVYMDLMVSKVEYYEDSFSIIFVSKNEFPDYAINCILDNKLSIDECIIE